MLLLLPAQVVVSVLDLLSQVDGLLVHLGVVAGELQYLLAEPFLVLLRLLVDRLELVVVLGLDPTKPILLLQLLRDLADGALADVDLVVLDLHLGLVVLVQVVHLDLQALQLLLVVLLLLLGLVVLVLDPSINKELGLVLVEQLVVALISAQLLLGHARLQLLLVLLVAAPQVVQLLLLLVLLLAHQPVALDLVLVQLGLQNVDLP